MSMNKLRDMAANGTPALGTFFSSGNMSMMECLGYTGFDYVIIDTEHGPFDTETMMNLIRAAESVGLVPMVRIADVTHKEIQRAADCGAQGIIVPCLRTLDDFKKCVDLAKYAPVGNRGFIKGRGCGFGNRDWACGSLEEYFSNSNDRLLVMPQCETLEALEQIESIVQIEGLDGIFVGPYDLSTCMGIPGQFNDPGYIAAEKRVLNACKNAGKICYVFTGTESASISQIKNGFDGVAHSIDFNVFTAAYKAISTSIRDGL